MASKAYQMCLALAIVVMLWGGATGQSACTSSLMSLAPCLNYVTGNSSTPSSSCCSSLSSVVQLQPQCLCLLLNGGGSSLGLTINQTLALQLPGDCNVQTPPVSQCNAAANGPTTSASSPASPPSSSPAESSENAPEARTRTTPTVPSIPSGTGSGSKTVPSTHGSQSGGSSNINTPLHLIGFILFIVSFTSIATSF